MDWQRRLGPAGLGAIGKALSRLLSGTLAFCYPGVCAACHGSYETADPLCPACMRRLCELETGIGCAQCGRPLVVDGAPCPWCQHKGLRPFETVVRLGLFAEPLRVLIHRLKYHRQWAMGEFLADRLYEQPRTRRLLEQADSLMPVPLHWVRQFSRGYNQSEVIAQRLASLSGLRLINAARRIRNTPTQTRLSHAQRLANLRNAFALKKPALVRGRRIVLVDDVMTTGATLLSIGRVVAAAHPASLAAITIAMVDPRGRSFAKLG